MTPLKLWEKRCRHYLPHKKIYDENGTKKEKIVWILDDEIMDWKRKNKNQYPLAATLLQPEAFITNLLYQLLRKNKISTKVFYDGEVDERWSESQYGDDKLDIELKYQGETVCIIENKLNADFGKNQLARYCEILKKSKAKNKKLVTLTKFDVSKHEQVKNYSADIPLENIYWHEILNKINDPDALEVMTSRYFRLDENMCDENKRDFYIAKIENFLKKKYSENLNFAANKTDGWCNFSLYNDSFAKKIKGSYSRIVKAMGAINVCLDGYAIRRVQTNPVTPVSEQNDMIPYFELSLQVFYYLKRDIEKDILSTEIPVPAGWHEDCQYSCPVSKDISERFLKISFFVKNQQELDRMIENENSELYKFIKTEIEKYTQTVQK